MLADLACSLAYRACSMNVLAPSCCRGVRTRQPGCEREKKSRHAWTLLTLFSSRRRPWRGCRSDPKFGRPETRVHSTSGTLKREITRRTPLQPGEPSSCPGACTCGHVSSAAKPQCQRKGPLMSPRHPSKARRRRTFSGLPRRRYTSRQQVQPRVSCKFIGFRGSIGSDECLQQWLTHMSLL